MRLSELRRQYPVILRALIREDDEISGYWKPALEEFLSEAELIAAEIQRADDDRTAPYIKRCRVVTCFLMLEVGGAQTKAIQDLKQVCERKTARICTRCGSHEAKYRQYVDLPSCIACQPCNEKIRLERDSRKHVL